MATRGGERRQFGAVARTRDGAITIAEAIDLGINPERLVKWVRTGRLVHDAPGAYVAGTPRTWRQQVRVATGSGAAWASHARLPRSGASTGSRTATSRS
jgi:hypothetical protein